MVRGGVAAACMALLMAGCASRASDISAAYVSPIPYEGYTCEQLGQEGQRVSARAAEVAGEQNQKATGDAVATTVGVIVFWPVLFAVKGDGPTATELARLKGELEAIEQVSIRKKCGIEFRRPA